MRACGRVAMIHHRIVPAPADRCAIIGQHIKPRSQPYDSSELTKSHFNCSKRHEFYQLIRHLPLKESRKMHHAIGYDEAPEQLPVYKLSMLNLAQLQYIIIWLICRTFERLFDYRRCSHGGALMHC